MMQICSLFSGSSGNCIFIQSEKTKLLIDAGVSCIRISRALSFLGINPDTVNAVLVTHEHSDHISGLSVFSAKYGIPVYASSKTWDAMTFTCSAIEKENRNEIDTASKPRFSIGDLSINCFPIPHDSAEPIAYNIYQGDKKVTVATDLGNITQTVYNNLMGSDAVLIEANHDVDMLRYGKYPWILKKRILGSKGHLSNEDCAYTVTELSLLGTKKFILGHLSKENNFPDLAYNASKAALRERGISVGRDVKLSVASRDTISEVIDV